MTTISVAKKFSLQLKPGHIVHVMPGTQDVSDEIADHWYTKLHLTKELPKAKATEAAPIAAALAPVVAKPKGKAAKAPAQAAAVVTAESDEGEAEAIDEPVFVEDAGGDESKE